MARMFINLQFIAASLDAEIQRERTSEMESEEMRLRQEEDRREEDRI